MPTTEIKVQVTPEAAGRTVVRALRESAQVSNAFARGLVHTGLVTLDGRRVSDPARRLRAGEILRACFERATRYREKPRRAGGEGYRIVLEDADLIAVEKEAGVLTVPTPTRRQGALVQRLLRMYAARGVKDPRLWAVHRLDEFTSGLVLFARTRQAAEHLIDQFRARRARRGYLALCAGVPEPPSGRLASRLVADPRTRRVRPTRDPRKGKEAVCRYRVEERLRGAALVRVDLETGRRNQIRVQFAALGHPILGDRTYGQPSDAISRTALHAADLGFTHPRTGREIRLTSALPADVRRALRRLRRGRSAD